MAQLKQISRTCYRVKLNYAKRRARGWAVDATQILSKNNYDNKKQPEKTTWLLLTPNS